MLWGKRLHEISNNLDKQVIPDYFLPEHVAQKLLELACVEAQIDIIELRYEHYQKKPRIY